MPVRQVTTPNVFVKAQRGWCLKYCDDGTNAPARQPSAQAAYNVENRNGGTRGGNPPEGVWAPIYFRFTSGPYVDYGHVAWAFNHGDWIEIRDSEVASGARGIYRSLGELMTWFGLYKPEYLGWSIWLDGVHIVEEYGTNPKMTPDSLVNAGLGPNQSLISNNGRYTLVMQSDGNMVIYKLGSAIWASDTFRSGANRAFMQDDGNFVVYANEVPKWASQTPNSGGEKLVMQDDGNLVIYNGSNKPVWATGTVGK